MRHTKKLNILTTEIGEGPRAPILHRVWVRTSMLYVLCLVAIAAVTGVAYFVYEKNSDRINQALFQAAKDYFLAFENELLNEKQAIASLAVVLGTLENVDEAHFQRFSKMIISDSISHQIIFWVTKNRTGDADIDLVGNSFKVMFGGMAQKDKVLNGAVLSRLKSLKPAFIKAQDKDTFELTSVMFPESGDQKFQDIVIIAPVFKPGKQTNTVENRRKFLQGFVVGIIQIGFIFENYIEQYKTQTDFKDINIWVLDYSAPLDKRIVFSKGKVPFNDRYIANTFRYTHMFKSFLKQWIVIVSPAVGHGQRALSVSVIAILFFGIMAVAGAGFFARYILLRNDWIIWEVKKQTLELKASHRQFLSLIERAPQGIIVHHNGKPLYVNPALVKMFNYASIDKILSLDSTLLLFKPDDQAQMRQYWDDLYKGKDIEKSIELEGVRKDGFVFTLNNRSFVINWNGQSVICSTLVDISERRKVVAALIDSEQRFKDFADSASDWYWEMDADLRFTYFSERLLEVTGLLAEDIIGRKWSIFYFRNGDFKDWTVHQKTLDLHQPFQNCEYSMKTKKGLKIFIRISGVPLFRPDGAFLGYRGVGTDNTQHKEDELKLQQAQIDLKNANNILEYKVCERTKELEFQKRALDEHGIVSITDVRGNIVYINEKFCDISGYSSAELIGQNHRILVSGEHNPNFFKEMWKTISIGQVWQGEIKNKNKSGEHYWVQTTIVPMLNDRGKPFQYVAIRTEITDVKRHEERLIEQQDTLVLQTHQLEQALQSEKEFNILQKQFVSMASHEFRTPLSIIDMTAQRLLKRNDDMTPEQRVVRYMKIRQASQRIAGLIERTLEAAKMDEGKLIYFPKHCDIKTIVHECVADQIEVSEDYTIHLDIEKLPDVVFADPGHLVQIFSNLLSNAVKYSPDHKTIEVRGWSKEDKAFVSVVDHGIGIADKDISKMFNRFFRTSNAAGIPGTGIGLSLVKKLVEMQGGNIQLNSIDGEGSTFCVGLNVDHPDEAVKL